MKKKAVKNNLFRKIFLRFVFLYALFFITGIARSQSQPALSFGGTDAYVTFGNNSSLGLSQFTLETWFIRTGAGVATSTGTGGTTAVPLIAKGRAEVDGDNRDLNYFLGISNTTNCLVADFEEDTSQTTPGLNHPVNGTKVILNNLWYHAAVTYDGSDWKLYLNGQLENQMAVGLLPQAGSIQHASIASALNSSGTAAGFFLGTMDEVRIWNYARSQTEIQSCINLQFNSMQPGLVALWGLNEGTGTVVNDSSSNVINGTISGLNYQWQSTGALFNMSFNLPPDLPSQILPADSSSCVFLPPYFSVHVTDPEADTLTVIFYLAQQTANAALDFTLIGLPDTQYYTGELNGGTNELFKAQTQWIVNNMDSLNIVFVEGLGDCVQNGDNGNNSVEWMRCDTALKSLEDTIATQLSDGLPYGVNVGNHDQTPFGNANGTTTLFNQYFGSARFASRNYYGGHFGNDNNSNYCLFSSGGLDFIVINFEYDDNRDTAELSWAHNILNLYNNRRAIIASHYILELNGNFSTQGQLLYDEFKIHGNVFMTMSGHVPGESSRVDSYLGNTIHSIMSDYQGRTNGGDGWLRLYHFSPGNNSVLVKTHSPTLNQWETDANSQFSWAYNMTPPITCQVIDTLKNVGSGTNASLFVQGLLPNTTYHWYVTVSDSSGTTTSQVYTFTTAAGPQVNIGNDTTICSTCSVLLNAGSGYNSYLWNDGSTSSALTASVAGLYFVQVTDSIGCISSDTIDITVMSSIMEAELNDKLVVFPNPAGNEVLLSSIFLLEANKFNLEVTDVLGRNIFNKVIYNTKRETQFRLVTADYPSGVYFVRISASGIVKKVKFIKQ